ncbi:WD40 repeat-like protein [Peniophora sp. CONT]|nr:WD40 repeat-like protein [Peniophora sp. CONT]
MAATSRAETYSRRRVLGRWAQAWALRPRRTCCESCLAFASLPVLLRIKFLDRLLGSAITPYKDTPKPSPYTSPLARFGIEPVIHGPNASPATIAFAEARCEIQSDEICRPARMRLAGDTLAILGAGGWKEQAGVLSIRDLSSGNDTDLNYSEKTYSLGRQGGYEIALDGTRKLVYHAGSRAINAYRYGFGKKGDEDFIMGEKEDAVADKGKSTDVAGSDSDDSDSEDEYDDDDDDVILGAQDGQDKLAFSLKTTGYEGVLGLTADGAKVLRTGSKGIGVWDIPSRSAGREAHFTSIDSKAFANVGVWAEHPSSSHQRLIASGESSFFVSSADVETGQVMARYVGHNHGVNAFATGKEDPHNFLTASSDGAVRFYDSRLPAPIFAIEQASGDDLQAALYEHIGGHPFIIIGGNKSQQVKIWDARTRTPLYRLSTGNNAVQALAWDGSRNHLFAATDCEYLGYHGTAFGYREAEFGDEDDDYYEEMAWPEKAWHDENSFGYPFDCGSHRLIRYSFKTEPDTKVLPEYGQAQPDEGGGGGFGGMW